MSTVCRSCKAVLRDKAQNFDGQYTPSRRHSGKGLAAQSGRGWAKAKEQNARNVFSTWLPSTGMLTCFHSDSNLAAHVTGIRFYSCLASDQNPSTSPYASDKLGTVSMFQSTRLRLSINRLPPLTELYPHFTSLESLSLLHEANVSHQWEGPSYVSFIALNSLWSTVWSHLRELNLVIYRDSLFELQIPTEAGLIPRLETMRVAYVRRWLPSGRETGEFLGREYTALAALAKIYTTPTLRTLENHVRNHIHVEFQPFPGPLLPPPFLSLGGSETPSFPKLWRLGVVLAIREEWAARFRAAESVHRFVMAHATTLQRVDIRGLLRSWDTFVVSSSPLSPSQPFALSLSTPVRDQNSTSRDIDIAVDRLAMFRNCIVELQVFFVPDDWDPSILSLMDALKSLRVGMYLKTKPLSELLVHTPKLISLSVAHQFDDFRWLEEQIDNRKSLMLARSLSARLTSEISGTLWSSSSA